MASQQIIEGALQPRGLAAARSRRRRGSSDGAFRYGMTLPTVLALLLVVAFPLAFVLYVSTHEYDLTEGGIGAFTGIENYARTIGDELIANAVRNTAILAVSVVAIELVIALGLSVLLNQPGLRFRNVYLAILLIPLLISPVAVGLICGYFCTRISAR